MDAIILAAGRNDRLGGHVPAYMKPLLVVNGHTLIGHQVNALALATRIIVVCSPDNVSQLIDVLGAFSGVFFIIQPKPIGVIDALEIGMELVESDYTIITCADNIIPQEHWAEFIAHDRPTPGQILISSRDLPAHETQRFTYFVNQEVREKVPPPNFTDHYRCWIGPLSAMTEDLTGKLEHGLKSLSQLIASYDPIGWKFIEGECSDVGVPGELP